MSIADCNLATPQPSNTARPAHGFTLLELLFGIAIAAILMVISHTAITGWLPKHRVIVATNNVLGVMLEARANAMSGRARVICDGLKGCQHFGQTNKLIMGADKNHNSALEDSEVERILNLPKNTWLIWRRFYGSAFIYRHNGKAYFQNGHFLICNKNQAKKIVMNWIGRPRVETANSEQCP